MSLYIRLFTNFWTHRKTARLRTLIGDAAFWIPQRLWSYAAENQPDGDFSSYEAGELEMLIGCPSIATSNATSIIQALQQCGFMDGMQIRGWKKYNSYHEAYAERARVAAEARWGKKESSKEKRKDRKGKETSNACSIPSKSRPTDQAEVEDYCRTIEVPDWEYFWTHWEANGFTNGNKAMKDWKATIRSWKAAGHLPSQKPGYKPPAREPEYWTPTGPNAHRPFAENIKDNLKRTYAKMAAEGNQEAAEMLKKIE